MFLIIPSIIAIIISLIILGLAMWLFDKYKILELKVERPND